jgi:phospholipase C
MIFMGTLEKTYSFMFKNLLRAVNPIKNRITRAECKVHMFINNQSIKILKNDGHLKAYSFMSPYINNINAGVVWADQDLKSSDHFYNPDTDRGLYGSSNAKKECMAYYTRALNEYFHGNIKNAMFYFGAASHLIQDLTVPQHANVKLLNSHRSYEKWIIRVHKHHDEFKISEDGIYLNSLKRYIDLNSREAISAYKKYSHEKNRHLRFYKITSEVLIMAQKTTAGFMLKFYNDIEKIKPIMISKQKKQFDEIVNASL